MNSVEVETVKKPISFDTHHDDVIHDAKVDFYGRRLATASSDRTIRIFQINENETETLLSILSGHEGPVWQVAWAHPKFGSILASCSYDGSVIIWQEDENQKSHNPVGTHSTWTKVKVHRIHDSSVNSISFSPHAFGLNLACASSDGKVSIFSQVGGEWQSQVISAHSTGSNSVSWAPSAAPSSLFAVDFKALDEKPVPLGPKMIATGGCDNTVKLWKAIEEEGENGVLKEKWILEATLDDHTDWVRDVCWRPSLGQVGHILVSCSQDKTVLFWKFNDEAKKWESKPLKQQPFADTLWRVSFSEYGHLLAVSCGDNTVTIWRENFDDGTWELAGNVNETVTESVKIEEPLAVAPPASIPIPEIKFKSSITPKILADVGYMKPMSPMIPAPSFPSANSTPGYQQFDQAYDDYQQAQTPTIRTVSQPLINSGILASAVISESVPYDHNSVQYEERSLYPEPQQDKQQYKQYNDAVEEFNKDIGFMTSAPQYKTSQYEQEEPTFEQPTFEQPTFEQPTFEQPTYEQSSYDQSDYVQPSYDGVIYDQSNYGQASYEGASYDPSSYEQSNSEQHENYDQTVYEQVSYEEVPYEAQTEAQYSYDQQSTYDPFQYEAHDQSSYYSESVGQQQQQQQQQQQETYNSYSEEPVQDQDKQQVDYTLQYEGYNPSTAAAAYSSDATGF